jgi:condensin-2 complex subunit G2
MATIDDACENISETESVTTCIVNLTTVASTLLSFLESNEPSSKLFDVVYKLHELLIPLSDEYSGASHFKNTIARVCESWWIHKWQGAEYLATQLLPHLLLASLEEGASSADVKRLYKVKEAFALLDFTDESIASIVDLLLRAMISPLYLKSAEGEKFLGYVLTLDSGCNVCPLIDAIKTQLAHCLRAKVATKYGAIIFRGWKDADDAGKLVMANEVQSLVYSGIHTQDAKYFQNIRLLMGELLEHKASKGVDAMLAELYDPILWRALSCANAAVRAQGSALFLDAFPLQNPSETGEQLEERLAMQFERMQSLLEDDDHRVRCVAATGVCRALGEYWEAFPLPVVKTLLLFLSTKLARDTASVHTRVATVAGLSDLIDNTASHRALLPLLKSVTFALHDKSDRVRLAFIGLLKRAHDIEGVHFYDIVPLEELLSRLVLDQGSPHCVLGLMQLLKASFYPSTDGDDQLNRCLSLIDADPAAAEVFYKELYRVASVGSATKMCVLLYSHMYDACVSDEDEVRHT